MSRKIIKKLLYVVFIWKIPWNWPPLPASSISNREYETWKIHWPASIVTVKFLSWFGILSKSDFFLFTGFLSKHGKPCQLDMSSRYLQLNYLLIDWQVSRMELHDIPGSSQYRFHDGCEFCGSSAFWENTFLSVPWSLGYLHDFVVYNWRNLWAQKVQSLLNRVRTKKVLKVCLVLKKCRFGYDVYVWYEDQSRYFEIIWQSIKLLLNWRKPENNSLIRYKIT